MSSLGVKFGVLLPTLSSSFEFVLRTATLAEDSGFDSVWCADHFIPTERSYRLFRIPTTFDVLGASPVLSALASRTTRMSLGTSVTPIPAHNPGILAKVAATADIVSNGRLVLGAGTGYNKLEFKGYGFPWAGYVERFHRMREGVEIIRRLWTEPEVDYSEKYYRLEKAVCYPKPVQKPHPPVWLGGKSALMIGAVAELGDGWLPAAMSPEDYREKAVKLERLAAEVGTSFGEIELGCFSVTNVSLDAEEALETSRRCIAAGEERSDVDVGTRLTWGVHGSPEMAVERVEEFIEAGVRHFVLHIIPQGNTIDCLRLVGEEVIPRYK